MASGLCGVRTGGGRASVAEKLGLSVAHTVEKGRAKDDDLWRNIKFYLARKYNSFR